MLWGPQGRGQELCPAELGGFPEGPSEAGVKGKAGIYLENRRLVVSGRRNSTNKDTKIHRSMVCSESSPRGDGGAIAGALAGSLEVLNTLLQGILVLISTSFAV